MQNFIPNFALLLSIVSTTIACLAWYAKKRQRENEKYVKELDIARTRHHKMLAALKDSFEQRDNYLRVYLRIKDTNRTPSISQYFDELRRISDDRLFASLIDDAGETHYECRPEGVQSRFFYWLNKDANFIRGTLGATYYAPRGISTNTAMPQKGKPLCLSQKYPY